ncbi:AraC family transcriptional regulator [Anaeromicropila herbilytica]|uniref:AraC family transcriptional regulator n=1 Tax=Anaeromicropila herbilytica TaxID=2785025 RepID=A0A7R7ELS8_9FIRM|nr:AraC family transcriptional regulator [Anaeromicropila herbilytica]BCN31230.1 AraC family transcriptional regulator [Anaeromicropila herbilytica]
MEKQKKGYLNDDFLLFHLKDQKHQEFEFHYHDFKKIIIFLSGNVTYLIEGKTYHLNPWDVLLINNNELHKPIIDPSVPYERIIIWLNSDFLESHNGKDYDITTCFHLANRKSFNLVRLDAKLLDYLKMVINGLTESMNSNEFANSLLSNTFLIQLLIYLNRIVLEQKNINEHQALKYDKQIEEILRYINNNLSSDISIEKLSDVFYINRYHLMHKFKDETGYSIHNYVIQKRLIQSLEYINQGIPITKASELSGFNDYSSFLRSFKKFYNKTPREYFDQNY